MNQNNTICSSCLCADNKFLHNNWNGYKGNKICTSCVLFANTGLFCPTCIDLVGDTNDLLCCVICGSKTHRRCHPSKDKPVEYVCSTCSNPERLIFDLQELRDVNASAGNRCHKVMDMEAARLLLTAAKIVNGLISEAHEEAVDVAAKHVTDAIPETKKAIGELERFMKFEDGPSLF